MNCHACLRPLTDDPGKGCPDCGSFSHGECWSLADGCAEFVCVGARGLRLKLLEYLDKQLTADLAVVSWIPIFLVGLILVVHAREGQRFVLLVLAVLTGILLVPVALAWARRQRLRQALVPVETMEEFLAVREARRATFFYRHRPLIAVIEVWVTNPILLMNLGLSTALSARRHDWVGVAISVVLVWGSRYLYLGPSRRAVKNPIRDFTSWKSSVDELVRRSGQVERPKVSSSGDLVWCA